MSLTSLAAALKAGYAAFRDTLNAGVEAAHTASVAERITSLEMQMAYLDADMTRQIAELKTRVHVLETEADGAGPPSRRGGFNANGIYVDEGE